ncbi:hypothetical protein GTQ99_00560 [Kineococcus sp. T13]|uniref:hypothetical protein n=1 Tax=Kineococcus vitellinus TaxID=2696565 RepID=UPI0014131CD4|nr:hypothetical protein [Kineococcus vitellinus]NAZ73923.1 hypothetical protein [Kineococcus vitellinus]
MYHPPNRLKEFIDMSRQAKIDEVAKLIGKQLQDAARIKDDTKRDAALRRAVANANFNEHQRNKPTPNAGRGKRSNNDLGL